MRRGVPSTGSAASTDGPSIPEPRTSDPAAAAPLDLLPAAVLSPIDLFVAPTEPRRIEGRITDIRTGKPPADAVVALHAERPFGDPEVLSAEYEPSTGRFAVEGLADGRYGLAISAVDVRGTGLDRRPRDAWLVLDIDGGDLTDLDLSIPRTGSLRGQVVLSDGTPLTQADPPFEPVPTLNRREPFLPAGPRISLNAVSALQPEGVNVGAELADGSFEVPEVLSGRYRVMLAAAPEGFYIDALRLNGSPVAGEIVDLSPDATYRLDVVLATDGGEVTGTVVDSGGAPRGGMVLLVPEPTPQAGGYLQTVHSLADGAFRLRSVPPGRYRIFAWEARGFEFPDPALLRRHQGEATRLTIDGGSAVIGTTVRAIDPE